MYHVVVPDYRDKRRVLLDMPEVPSCLLPRSPSCPGIEHSLHSRPALPSLSPCTPFTLALHSLHPRSSLSLRAPSTLPISRHSRFIPLQLPSLSLRSPHTLPPSSLPQQVPGHTFPLGDITGSERLDEFEQVAQGEVVDTSSITRVTEVRVCVRISCVCGCTCSNCAGHWHVVHRTC